MYAKLTDQQKERIGIWIRYYRKKHKLTQQAFLESRICARSTLSAIENGKAIKEDMVYYELLDSIHLTYEPDAKWDEQMHHVSKKLMNAALTLHQQEIEQTVLQIQTLFQGKQHLFYYREYALAFHAVLQNLREYRYVMSQQEYEFYMQTLAFFPEELRILLIHLCFSCCFNETAEIKKARLMEPLLKANSYNILMSIDLFLLHVEAKQYDQIYMEQQAIMQKLYQQQLWNRLYEFKAIRLREQSLLATHERKEMCDELYEHVLAKNTQLHVPSVNFIRKHLAILYFSEYKDYARTYELVKYLLQYDHQDEELYMILLLLCEEKLGITIHADILTSINWCQKTQFLYYFKCKYLDHKNDDDLLNYIMKVIKPSLKMKTGSLFVELFKNEIEHMLASGDSKRYKDYFDFCMEFTHSRKDKN